MPSCSCFHMSVLYLLSLSWYKCAGRAFLRQTLHWKPTSLIKSNGRQLECAESRNQQFVRKQFGHSLELWPTDLTWISNVKITPIILKDFVWWIKKDQIGVWDLEFKKFLHNTNVCSLNFSFGNIQASLGKILGSWFHRREKLWFDWNSLS